MANRFVVNALVREPSGSLVTSSLPVEAEAPEGAAEAARHLLVATNGGELLHVAEVLPLLPRWRAPSWLRNCF